VNLLSALTLARTSLLALADSPGAGTRNLAYAALGTLDRARFPPRIYEPDTEDALVAVCLTLGAKQRAIYDGSLTAFQARALARAIGMVEDAVEREERTTGVQHAG
jgi:hypothetical protein